jgi:hypothetical protein
MKLVYIILFSLNTQFALSFTFKDKGIGVIYFNKSISTQENPISDSILIYENISSKTPIAIFYFSNQSDSNRFFIKNYKFKTMIDFDGIEFANETNGLPIDTFFNDYFRVMFGYDVDYSPIFGWVKMNYSTLNYILWKEHLLEKPIYFLNTFNFLKFYSVPNGKLLTIKLDKNENEHFEYLDEEFKYNYIMYPLEKKGIWLKVKVESPSTYCNEPKKPREFFAWIKYIDERGRPLVWYYTRGC